MKLVMLTVVFGFAVPMMKGQSPFPAPGDLVDLG